MQSHGVNGSDSSKQRRRDNDACLPVPSGGRWESLHSRSVCLEDAVEMSQKLEHVEALRDFYVWWAFNAACLRRRQQEDQEVQPLCRRNSIPEVPIHTMNSGTSTAATTTATSNTSRQDSFGSSFATNSYVELTASLPDGEDVHGVKTNCRRQRAKSLTPALTALYGSQPRPWTLSCFLSKTGSVRRSFIHFEGADLLFHKFPTRFLSRFAVQEPNGLFLEHERINSTAANLAAPHVPTPPVLPHVSHSPGLPFFCSLTTARGDLETDHLETFPAADTSAFGIPSYSSSSMVYPKTVFSQETHLGGSDCTHGVDDQTPVATFYSHCASPSTAQRLPDTSGQFSVMSAHGEPDCSNTNVPLTVSGLPEYPTAFSCNEQQSISDPSLAPNVPLSGPYVGFSGSGEASVPLATNVAYNGNLETREHPGWIESSPPYGVTLVQCCSSPADPKGAPITEPQITVPDALWAGPQPVQFPITLETPEAQPSFVQCYAYQHNPIGGQPEVPKRDDQQLLHMGDSDPTHCAPLVFEKLPSMWIEPASRPSYQEVRVIPPLHTQHDILQHKSTVRDGEAVGQTELMSEKKGEAYVLSAGSACRSDANKGEPQWPTREFSGLKSRRFFHAPRRPHFRGGPSYHPTANGGKKGGFEHSRPPMHRHTFAPPSQLYSWRRPWTPRQTPMQQGPEAEYQAFRMHGYGRDSGMQTERSGYAGAPYFHADRGRKSYMYAPSGLPATKPEGCGEMSLSASCSTTGHGEAEGKIISPEEGKTDVGKRIVTQQRNATVAITGQHLSHQQYWTAPGVDRKLQSSQPFSRRGKMNSGFVHTGRSRPSGPVALPAPTGGGFPRGFRYTLPRPGANPGHLHREYKGRAGKENKKGKSVVPGVFPEFALKADSVSEPPQDAAEPTACANTHQIEKQGSGEATLCLENTAEVISQAPQIKHPSSEVASQQLQRATIQNLPQALKDTANNKLETKNGAPVHPKQTKQEQQLFHQRQPTSVATLGPTRQERHRGRRKPYIQRSLTVGAAANGRVLHVSELGETSAELKGKQIYIGEASRNAQGKTWGGRTRFSQQSTGQSLRGKGNHTSFYSKVEPNEKKKAPETFPNLDNRSG